MSRRRRDGDRTGEGNHHDPARRFAIPGRHPASRALTASPFVCNSGPGLQQTPALPGSDRRRDGWSSTSNWAAAARAASVIYGKPMRLLLIADFSGRPVARSPASREPAVTQGPCRHTGRGDAAPGAAVRLPAGDITFQRIDAFTLTRSSIGSSCSRRCGRHAPPSDRQHRGRQRRSRPPVGQTRRVPSVQPAAARLEASMR